jgi:hypothetical protein
VHAETESIGITILGEIRSHLWYGQLKGENMLLERTLKAQKKIDQASAQLKQIEAVKVKVASERAEATERLQGFKAKLPRLLARRSLAQATDGEISAIKRKIMDLEALLADLPLTLQGLDELERPIRNSMRAPRRLLSTAGGQQHRRDELKVTG